MIKLVQLITSQLTPSAITVAWQFESSIEDFNDYTLSLWQSESPSNSLSDYTLIESGINPAITSSADDTTVGGITDKFVDYFYVLSVSGLYNNQYFMSIPYGISVQEDKYAREIERRRNLVLNYHSGQTFYILKRKAWGTFCPVCYDPTLGRTTQSKDLTCYDTGFLGGYFSPLTARGQFNERPTREVHQIFGQWQDQDAVLYMDATPPVAPKDIVVDRLYRRWVVLNVGYAQKSMHAFAQIIQIRQVEKEDIIYQFPVDITQGI